MIWFTSDLHFGHERIIDYCDRPWSNLEEMEDGLINNINRVVGPDDDLYILGDVFFVDTQKSQEILRKIHGVKTLIRGNHDRINSLAKAKEIGFEGFLNNGVIELGHHRINLSHYPYRGDSGPEDRHPERRIPDNGRWLLHGHVHRTWKVKRAERMINVGCDVWNYAPINEQDVINIIRGKL